MLQQIERQRLLKEKMAKENEELVELVRRNESLKGQLDASWREPPSPGSAVGGGGDDAHPLPTPANRTAREEMEDKLFGVTGNLGPRRDVGSSTHRGVSTRSNYRDQ